MTPESLLIVLMSSHMLIRCCCYKKVQVRSAGTLQCDSFCKGIPGHNKNKLNSFNISHTFCAAPLRVHSYYCDYSNASAFNNNNNRGNNNKTEACKILPCFSPPSRIFLKTMRIYIYKIKHTARDETSKNVGQRSFYDGIYMTNNDVNKWNAKQCLNYASQPIDSVNLWTIKHDIFPGILSYLIV